MLLNPINFSSIRFHGDMGYDWTMMEFNLLKLITQNILYSTYHEPKTISEIAISLGLKNDLVAEEVEFLEDNAFIEKISNNKYQANILLHDFSEKVYEERHKIFTKYANLIYDTYIAPLCKDYMSILPIIDSFPAQNDNNWIVSPKNNINVLLWSIISFACTNKMILHPEKQLFGNHLVKRNDGGENIALAYIEKDYKLSYNKAKYEITFEVILYLKSSKGKPFSMWICNTFFDNRQNFDWSYIFKKEHTELYDNYKNSNMVVTSMSANELLNILPAISDEIHTLNKELGEQLFEISKSEYPKHMLPLCKLFYQNAISNSEITTRIIEQAMKKGVLKKLNETQKKTVNMILFLE